MLECAAFPLAYECHSGSDCRPDLQDNPDYARHIKVRCAHCRVVKHLRANIDRHALPTGFAQKRFYRLGQRHTESGVKGLQRRRRVGSVDKQLYLCGVTRIEVTSEGRRDVQRGVGAAFPHFALKLIQAVHLAHHTKRLRIHEAIDQQSALNAAIFIQNEHRHVFDVVIQRVTERHHLDQWRKEKEEERQRIARDDDEFFKENRAEPAK